MRRKGCQEKWKSRIVRQTTYASRRRTKSNTQRYMGSYDLQRFAPASRNREQVAVGGLWLHQRVAIGRTRNANNLLIFGSTASLTTKFIRTSSTCKELQNKSKNLWLRKDFLKKTHQETISWVRRPRRKFMKQASASYMKFIKELTKYNVNVAFHA